MIFGRKPAAERPVVAGERLAQLIRERLLAADEDAIRLAVAVTGLLAAVAYADREYSAPEQARVRATLDRLAGLDARAVEAICATLREQIVTIATGNIQAYTRDLRDLTELEERREVLDVLVDLAAVDDELSLSETDLLRRITAALGLTPDDYLNSQARYRDRLSVLK